MKLFKYIYSNQLENLYNKNQILFLLQLLTQKDTTKAI
jgi:hypothetical protein